MRDRKKRGGATGANARSLPTPGDTESFAVWAGKASKQASIVQKAQELLSSERGALGGIYTSMRDAGISASRIAVFKKTLKEEKRDPADRMAEARELAWQAKVLNSPMVQLGLFVGLLNEPTLEEYELMGEHMGRKGESADLLPGKEGSPERTHAMAGWKKGQKENADKLADKMAAGGGVEEDFVH